MIYLSIMLYTYIYSYVVRVKSDKILHFLTSLFPVILLLILTLGLQYDVGTDYYSYISVASKGGSYIWLENKNEILMIKLVDIVRKIGVPQLIFLFLAIIQVIFLMLIFFELRKINYKIHTLFFLYFTLSLSFFNQFNLIRQYTAVYIIIYAIFKLLDNKRLLFISLVVLASLFHATAIYFLVFLFLEKILRKRISNKTILIMVFTLFIIVSFDISKYIAILLSYTKYSHYATVTYFGRLPLKGIITKIPKLMISISSALLINNKNREITKKEKELLNLSYIGIAVQILSFSSTIIWRLYHYLDFFTIFPVLILLKRKGYKNIKIIIIITLIIMLITKIIIFPSGEYLYRSILFK